MKKSHDLISLLKEFGKITHRYNEDPDNHYIAYHYLNMRFYAFRQKELTPDDFYKQFMSWTEVIGGYNEGGKFGSSTGATTREIRILGLDENKPKDMKETRELARE